MRRNEHNSQSSIDHQTQVIASELELRPTDEVFRFLHPVMICGVENGKILLHGTTTNGTNVVDRYSVQKQKIRASALPNPGLNFTRRFHNTYKNERRRLAVAMKMADQPSGLQIFNDVGSEANSLYFTLPENTYFRVDVKEGNLLEIGIALTIRHLMNKLNIAEEPGFYNWINDTDGVRVGLASKGLDKALSFLEVRFLQKDKSFVIETTQGSLDASTELLAVLRLYLENNDFQEVIGTTGERYTPKSLQNIVQQNPEFQQYLSSLNQRKK